MRPLRSAAATRLCRCRRHFYSALTWTRRTRATLRIQVNTHNQAGEIKLSGDTIVALDS